MLSLPARKDTRLIYRDMGSWVGSILEHGQVGSYGCGLSFALSLVVALGGGGLYKCTWL